MSIRLHTKPSRTKDKAEIVISNFALLPDSSSEVQYCANELRKDYMM